MNRPAAGAGVASAPTGLPVPATGLLAAAAAPAAAGAPAALSYQAGSVAFVIECISVHRDWCRHPTEDKATSAPCRHHPRVQSSKQHISFTFGQGSMWLPRASARASSAGMGSPFCCPAQELGFDGIAAILLVSISWAVCAFILTAAGSPPRGKAAGAAAAIRKSGQ